MVRFRAWRFTSLSKYQSNRFKIRHLSSLSKTNWFQSGILPCSQHFAAARKTQSIATYFIPSPFWRYVRKSWYQPCTARHQAPSGARCPLCTCSRHLPDRFDCPTIRSTNCCTIAHPRNYQREYKSKIPSTALRPHSRSQPPIAVPK